MGARSARCGRGPMRCGSGSKPRVRFECAFDHPISSLIFDPRSSASIRGRILIFAFPITRDHPMTRGPQTGRFCRAGVVTRSPDGFASLPFQKTLYHVYILLRLLIRGQMPAVLKKDDL